MMNTIISARYKCETSSATNLTVYEVHHKLTNPGQHDIGGSFTSDGEPEFWFYMTTTAIPSCNYLLNLFVCHRKTGYFSIGVGKTSVLKEPLTCLQKDLEFKTCNSIEPNTKHYIKTICFSEEKTEQLKGSILNIPINIVNEPEHILDKELINRIKSIHNGSDIFSKQKYDCVLKSSSGKEFNCHKIVMAAHSPVLKELLKNKHHSMFLDITDEEMELLLNCLYNKNAESVLKQDARILLKMAGKFQLKNLFQYVQFICKNLMNVENVVEMILISEEYHMEELQEKAFEFIKLHPEVQDTEGWKNLNNLIVMKKLMYSVFETMKKVNHT